MGNTLRDAYRKIVANNWRAVVFFGTWGGPTLIGTKGQAALVFLDGNRCEGEARLVQSVGDRKYWTGTFGCGSALFLGNIPEGLFLECGQSKWLVRIIKSSLDGFANIQTAGKPLNLTCPPVVPRS